MRKHSYQLRSRDKASKTERHEGGMMLVNAKKSAITHRRFKGNEVVQVFLISACLLVGCERRNFANPEYAFASLKPGTHVKAGV
ncbi:hypothetical protein EUQ83_24560 [Salmonella enterica subsp. enterica serovar Newport]|uniref:Uncharacterized protein n=1 Tax=Salmonella enterica TaxID=28901 RepID=A0A760GRX9_SALER|nr:hypothetical protein [Salmonella enterica subsp. enterica serovar Kottbus]ECE7454962.1 hypothetical protein [Salmonella enterica subsp. enterica serovar Newport]EEB3146979.1 hypothetical protein [Salmonella enterica subsp. enterica serovar Newport]HAG2460735.1 hypothetical protein [Salmonella enterica]HAK8849856.1 hypothetical protein [Salmonella enterica]